MKYCRAATRVDRDEASAGDLVHYPGHVMMYLGVGDAVVHSVHTGRTVEIDTISKTRASRVIFGNPIDWPPAPRRAAVLAGAIDQ